MKLLVKILKSWWFPWLVLGVILRLVLAAITAHPDLWALNFSGYLLAFKGVPNIYDYLAGLPGDHEWSKLYGPAVFTYPPLAYFSLGIFVFFLKPFFNLSFLTWFTNHSLIDSLGNPELFRHLILLKFPYLFFDIGMAFLFLGLFKEERKKKWAFLLWIFNPLSFYTSFMVGQFDVIPVFFVILSLYLASLGRKNWALVLLGIGGSLKLFPLLFLPFFILVLGKNNWEKARLAFLGGLPYFLTIFPFLSSSAFRQVVLFSNQSQKMLFMGLSVSGAEGLYVFVVFLVLLWFWAGYTKHKMDDLWKYIFVTLLLFFSVTHYHPQWFLWITPFMILEMVKSGFQNKWLHLTLFTSWFLLLLFFEPSLSYGLFSPLWSQLAKAQGISEILVRYIDIFQFKNLIRSIFAATAIFLSFRLFTRPKVDV